MTAINKPIQNQSNFPATATYGRLQLLYSLLSLHKGSNGPGTVTYPLPLFQAMGATSHHYRDKGNTTNVRYSRDPPFFVNPQAEDLAHRLSECKCSLYTAQKAGGGVRWMYLRSSPLLAHSSLLAFPGDYCVCLFAPHPFCVDENPRLTVCTRIAYLRCEPTLRASYSIHFFGVFHNRIYESVSTTIHTASSHTGAFSIHGLVPVTRLSLDTHSNNRRSFLFLYMLVSHPGATPYDVHTLDTVARTKLLEPDVLPLARCLTCCPLHPLPGVWAHVEASDLPSDLMWWARCEAAASAC
ncbi:hypothetical protein B0H13DRAFT_1896117 [Mycena leptocephala]|nr:hypothetical protein B0H13DRAFT_1896117 [Mycena leptocephala]